MGKNDVESGEQRISSTESASPASESAVCLKEVPPSAPIPTVISEMSAANGDADGDTTAQTAPITTSKAGCHLRWSRITKVVEVKESTGGLLRGSIAASAPAPNVDDDVAKGKGTTTKVILNEVSAEARPGEVLALMGPSGSGKTSLLDALSGRSAYESGTLTMDASPVTGSNLKRLKRKIAYIKQSDIFFDHLTVRDQLTYTALLRLPSKGLSALTREEKVGEVDRILRLLRLTKCADTPIRLVSGGERKRVNIGTELLTDPGVLMLDEPTSGLDSTSAVALLGMLTELARTHGKTVVTSIHQPSSKVFQSFDRLLLLADGCVVYFGSPLYSLSYLKEHGYECPPGYNAADHWMDLLVVDSALEGGTVHNGGGNSFESSADSFGENAALEKAKKVAADNDNLSVPVAGDDDGPDDHTHLMDVFNRKKTLIRRRSSAIKLSRQQRARTQAGLTSKARLVRAWDNDEVADEIDITVEEEQRRMNQSGACDGDDQMINEKDSEGEISGGDETRKERKFNTSWLTQFVVLTHRCMKNSRSAIFTPLNIIKSVCLGVMTGLLWFQMPYTENTVEDRASYFFFSMTYWVFDAMFGALFSFPQEREVIFKERASGSYHLSAYFMAKTTSEAPTRLSLPAIYMVISYWMAGINPRFVIFLGSTICCLLSVLAGESIGLLIGAVVMDFEKAMVVMVVFALSLMVAGGYYVSNIPSFLVWFQYLSPFRYAYNASSQLAFDRPVPCDDSGVLEVICGADDSTGYATPDEVKQFLGISGTVGFNAGLLLVIFFVPRYLAFLALKRKKGAERS